VAASLFVSVREGAAVRVCRDIVRLRTERRLQFVDVTALVEERVRRSWVRDGMVTVQSRHTTAALLVSESEPLLLQDFEDLLARWAPADERPNSHAHAQALLLGASVCLNVAEGQLDLGEGQSVFLVELDGPRDRTLSVQVLGVGADHGGRPA
jgi:secondary thiamine-phosphate synthase enzyme